MKTNKLFALLIVAILICALPVLAAPEMIGVENAEENVESASFENVATLSSFDYNDYDYKNTGLKDGYYTYTYYNKGSGEWTVITDCNTSISGNVSIPSMLGPDAPVTGIADEAFRDCVNITSITVSTSNIGEGVFRGCTGLIRVEFTNRYLSSISDYMFYDCNNLQTVNIPNCVTYIGDNAFYNCSSLESITISDSVTSIGENTFDGCNNLTIYGIAGSYVESYANDNGINFVPLSPKYKIFLDPNGGTVDTEYKEIYEISNNYSMPTPVYEGYTFMGWYTEAEGGELITKDAVASTSQDYTVYAHWEADIASGTCGTSVNWTLGANGNLLITGNGTMNDYDAPWDEYRDSIINVVIEDGVTYIGSEAFFMCANLTDIEIPDSVTSIGDYAFYNCTSLGETTLSDNVISIGAFAFGGCTNVKLLCNYQSYAHTFADANSVAYDLLDVDDWGKCGDNVYWKLVDGTLTLSGTGATYNYNYNTCPFLYSRFDSGNAIVIEEGITILGEYIFYDFRANSVVFPETLEKIRRNAFSYNNFKSISIPNSVTYIGSYAFNSCYMLENVHLSNNITRIYNNTFSSCDELKNITIPSSVVAIEDLAFYSCELLTIYGYSFSFAENYAETNNIPFVCLNSLITYNANMGTDAPETQIKYDDVDVTISEDVPERVDYTFLGWATTADATVPEYFPGDVYSTNEDLTLYAVWESNFGEEIFFTDFNADTVIVRNMGTSTAPSIRFLDGVTENLTMTDNDTAYVWDNTNGYVTTNAGSVTTPVLGLNVTFADKGLYTVKFDYLASDVNVTAIKVLANASEHTVLVTTTGEWVNVVSTFMLGENLSSVSIGAVFADAGDSTASFDNVRVYREDITNPVTYPGASIRALDNNKLGIRFMASVMHEVWDDDNSEVGFIIARKSVLGDTELAFGCGIPTAHGAAKIGDIRRVYQDLEDGVYFTGVLRGIPDGAENEVMVGRPYMKIGDNYYYGDIIERSVLDVALAVKDNEEAYENCTEELKQAIDSMIDKHFPDNESFINPDGLFGNV